MPEDDTEEDMTEPVSRPDDSFRRWDIRVLDPATAVRLPGAPAPEVTAYRGNVLMVTAADRAGADALIDAIEEVGKDLHVRRAGPSPFERDPENPEHDRRALILQAAAATGIPLVFPYFLEPDTDDP